MFVLTDDLSMDLLRYMPRVEALAAHGMSFSNYFVSDSLCCPSRASIFTGLFPHDSGVYANNNPTGGSGAFWSHGDEQKSFNLALQRSGYLTATTYEAMRTRHFLYVEYEDGEHELYGLRTDPYELHNIASSAPRSCWRTCTRSCWRSSPAMAPPAGPPST